VKGRAGDRKGAGGEVEGLGEEKETNEGRRIWEERLHKRLAIFLC